MNVLRHSTQAFLALNLLVSSVFFVPVASAIPFRTLPTDTSTPQETSPTRVSPDRQTQPRPTIQPIPAQLSEGYYCCTSGGACTQVDLLAACDLKYHCYETENESVCEPE